MTRLLILFLLLPLLWSASCNSTKKGTEQTDDITQSCQTPATVKDFTGLDGCSFLLVLDNGDKLLPVKTPEGAFKFKDGQKIAMDYTIMKDYMSVCMAERAAIEITCMELIADTKISKDCVKTDDAGKVEWMRNILAKEGTREVTRYEYKDGWAYYFISGRKNTLYDCRGTEICSVTGKMMNDCVRMVNGFGKGMNVWKSYE